MTPDEYIEWLSGEIVSAEMNGKAQDYDPEASQYCEGFADALKAAKEKFLSLTPPPTTLS
jgi:hypothetical protein